MNHIIFGGAGFIGTHLAVLLRAESPKNPVYVVDLTLPEDAVRIAGVTYLQADVRQPLELPIPTTGDDVIYNLAAVHRTPGHADSEYFQTNICGAENVTAFAEMRGIRRMLFTSSIAPYGPSESLKTEETLPTPETPYGISKLVAEKIHETWQARDPARMLTILRPGVVFGKGEKGNFTRLYWGIRRRYFFYTGRRDTIKGGIYVKDLVRFMKDRMVDRDVPGVDLFNCTFEPAYTIEQIVETMQSATGMKRRVFTVPGGLLMAAARLLGPLGGRRIGIHPERVRKLMVSTNVSGKKMTNSGFQFRYDLASAIADWYQDCHGEGLY